jgi:hypothetical protein
MAYVTGDALATLDELQAEVRYAYGECIINDEKIKYTSEPAKDITDLERRQILENFLDHVADILEEYEDDQE